MVTYLKYCDTSRLTHLKKKLRLIVKVITVTICYVLEESVGKLITLHSTYEDGLLAIQSFNVTYSQMSQNSFQH